MATVLQDFDGTQHPFCSETGICESCKFSLVCGSIVPIRLEILDIRSAAQMKGQHQQISHHKKMGHHSR
jgi:hypothetical protein